MAGDLEWNDKICGMPNNVIGDVNWNDKDVARTRLEGDQSDSYSLEPYSPSLWGNSPSSIGKINKCHC